NSSYQRIGIHQFVHVPLHALVTNLILNKLVDLRESVKSKCGERAKLAFDELLNVDNRATKIDKNCFIRKRIGFTDNLASSINPASSGAIVFRAPILGAFVK